MKQKLLGFFQPCRFTPTNVDSVIAAVLCFPEQMRRMFVYVLLDVSDQLLGQFQRFAIKHNEDDFHLMCKQELTNLGKSDIQCLVLWKPVYT